jgi:hypothetical protein
MWSGGAAGLERGWGCRRRGEGGGGKREGRPCWKNGLLSKCARHVIVALERNGGGLKVQCNQRVTSNRLIEEEKKEKNK